jgi:hypothetical protein
MAEHAIPSLSVRVRVIAASAARFQLLQLQRLFVRGRERIVASDHTTCGHFAA